MSTLKKPEVSKEAVAAGVTSMSAQLRRREALCARLDQTIEEFGRLYGELSQVQKEIGQQLFQEAAFGGAMPAWLADSTTNYRLRQRLAVACSPHSPGGANESPFGLVQCRLTLAEIAVKDHGAIVKGR